LDTSDYIAGAGLLIALGTFAWQAFRDKAKDQKEAITETVNPTATRLSEAERMLRDLTTKVAQLETNQARLEGQNLSNRVERIEQRTQDMREQVIHASAHLETVRKSLDEVKNLVASAES
jgi:TolA-binding protein